MKNRHCILLCLALYLTACATYTPSYVPDVENIGLEKHGSYIKVYKKAGVIVSGELISINENELLLLRTRGTSKSVIAIPVIDIDKFILKYAQPKRYGWSIPVFLLASVGHGLLAIFTAPINLIVTIAVTSGGADSFQYSQKDMTYEKLKMFARFPQGIPDGIELSRIQ